VYWKKEGRRNLTPRGVFVTALALGLSLWLGAAPAAAYIGPGAGFAVASTGVLLVTVFFVVGILLILPFRLLIRAMRGKKTKPLIKRLIIVGYDGQDPKITDKFMKEGKLPNFEKLAKQGCYSPLATTYPSISPVAWSSFSTGTQPGKHNIFDFLDRDLRTYLPLLSSTHIGTIEKSFGIGKFKFRWSKTDLRLLRKSKPFWTILGEYNIWNTVLRVPITFPPDKFYGAQISAMCVPDLLGTQGTFLLFTTRPPEGSFKEGGLRVDLVPNGKPDHFTASINGPDDDTKLPMTVQLDRVKKTAKFDMNGEELNLEAGVFSDWVTLKYNSKVSGLCRMLITEMDEHFSIYMTPIAIDPEKPAMPVSHPNYYSTYLAKKVGQYSTLGLAEDTWALNEGVVGDEVFLEQTYDIDKERENMFFAALDRLRKGSLVCVFDATDRIQHMFWRYTEEGHPAAEGIVDPEHKNAIEELYVHNDKMLGRIMEKIGKDDVLMVLSDHGFTSFRRGVNLNAWLYQNGYLKLKEGADGSSEWLRDVDWSQTRAYSVGLTGMFLNLKGREAEGIVEPEDAQALKDELVAKMSGLVDDEKGEVGITELFDTKNLYGGPYMKNAPDFIVGYNSGYRVSWDCATGMVSGPIFEDNTKAWSGDHGVDPRQVPGVLFCNHKVDDDDPALIDIAPTALELFGITPPDHMDGKSIINAARFAERDSA